MKRKQKMLLLLLALVLCVGGYYGAQLLTAETAAVNEESGRFALNSHGADELTGLAWDDMAFSLTEGTWTVAADPAYPVNQEEVQQMADDLLALEATRQLDGVTDLAAYGLAEPAFTVTATWSDGTATSYTLGDETPFGDGYYISIGHENIVYTVEDDFSGIFDATLNDLAVLESIPAVSGATRLVVGGTLDIVKEETSRTINAGELWYDHLSGAALDVNAAEELAEAASGLAWAELAEATATDAELASFGVDEANATSIMLYEDETPVLTLLIGSQNESGDYYARLPGSAMVYTVESADVAPLLTASAEAMPSQVIIDLAAEKVQSVLYTAGEHTYLWQTETEPETEDAAAENETDEAENEAGDDPGAALWSAILALKAESRTEAADGNVLLAVEVYAKDGQSAVLTFTEHDAEHYAVTVLDRCFLVDAAEVDAMIRSLRAIK